MEGSGVSSGDPGGVGRAGRGREFLLEGREGWEALLESWKVPCLPGGHPNPSWLSGWSFQTLQTHLEGLPTSPVPSGGTPDPSRPARRVSRPHLTLPIFHMGIPTLQALRVVSPTPPGPPGGPPDFSCPTRRASQPLPALRVGLLTPPGLPEGPSRSTSQPLSSLREGLPTLPSPPIVVGFEVRVGVKVGVSFRFSVAVGVSVMVAVGVGVKVGDGIMFGLKSWWSLVSGLGLESEAKSV